MAMGATWKTKADAAGRSDATPHLCGIFPSFLFSSISALAESEQGMRLSHSYGLRSKTMPGFGILAPCGVARQAALSDGLWRRRNGFLCG